MRERRTWKLAMPFSKPAAWSSCATGATARGASAGLTTGASAALYASEGAKAAIASICVWKTRPMRAARAYEAADRPRRLLRRGSLRPPLALEGLPTPPYRRSGRLLSGPASMGDRQNKGNNNK